MIDGRPSHNREGLARDLRALGVEPGVTLMVHSSLKAIGWVQGGPSTVVQALQDALGQEGTLAMPAATPLGGDPATWTLFDRETTPTTLGAIPETFRTWPMTERSDHPLESVCASGPLASEITREHPLAFSEGEGGPFGKLYTLGSWILLLGVGFNRCTALHFAESLVEKRRTTTVRFPRLENGRRVVVEVPNVADDHDMLFPDVGARYVAAGKPNIGAIGEAASTLFPMRELVDFTKRYFEDVLPEPSR